MGKKLAISVLLIVSVISLGVFVYGCGSSATGTVSLTVKKVS